MRDSSRSREESAARLRQGGHTAEGVLSLLAAHPTEKLLDLDAVEASDDPHAAQAQHWNALAVEVFPFAPGRWVSAHRSVLELDTHLVQDVGHRGRLQRPVGAIEDGIRRAANSAVHAGHASLNAPIRQIDCFDRSHKESR